MGVPRPPEDPLAPPLAEPVRRYYLRIEAGGLLICLVGVASGVLLQRAHYRGQAGMILAIVSGMLGVFFAFGLASLPPGRRN